MTHTALGSIPPLIESSHQSSHLAIYILSFSHDESLCFVLLLIFSLIYHLIHHVLTNAVMRQNFLEHSLSLIAEESLTNLKNVARLFMVSLLYIKKLSCLRERTI